MYSPTLEIRLSDRAATIITTTNSPNSQTPTCHMTMRPSCRQ